MTLKNDKYIFMHPEYGFKFSVIAEFGNYAVILVDGRTIKINKKELQKARKLNEN